MVRLALGRVDLGEEFELDVVGRLFRLRVARESDGGRLQIDLQLRAWHVRRDDREEYYVLLGRAGGGALGPGYWCGGVSRATLAVLPGRWRGKVMSIVWK